MNNTVNLTMKFVIHNIVKNNIFNMILYMILLNVCCLIYAKNGIYKIRAHYILN